MEKILAVVNPVSGNKDKEPIISMIKNQLSSNQCLDILRTTGQNDMERINEAIQKTEPHRIIAIGGDGTIKLIAEAESSADRIIGIVPAGSANGLATELNLSNEPEEAVKIALSNDYKEADVLCIKDQLCIHISDMGLNAELISQYSNQPVRSFLGYALSALPTLPKAKNKYLFTIKTPDSTHEKEAIMVAFTNCRKFGTGVTINPNGIINDGKFEVLIVKTFNALEVLKTLNDDIPIDREFIEVIQTTEVSVRVNKSIPFQIDGEGCGHITETSVTILPAKIKVAVK